MANTIKVGKISSTNPSLWLDLATLEPDSGQYEIATTSPAGNWLSVNQFCALLSIQWLLSDRSASPYGIGNFSDPEKIAMARQLIGFSSLDDQVEKAETQLGGTRRSLSVTASGVEGTYPVGTQIWAGNDFHVLGIYLISPTEYQLYDSNTGLTTKQLRSTFRNTMELLRNTAFVVKER
jgi:hypothetical protein